MRFTPILFFLTGALFTVALPANRPRPNSVKGSDGHIKTNSLNHVHPRDLEYDTDVFEARGYRPSSIKSDGHVKTNSHVHPRDELDFDTEVFEARGNSPSSIKSNSHVKTNSHVHPRDELDFDTDVFEARGNSPSSIKGHVKTNSHVRPRDELDYDTDLLEAREPKQPAKIVFSRGARNHLDNLGLHGKDRKRVKNFHKNVVKGEMKKHGADSARIVHLAHTQGSKDPKLHVTANLWNGKKSLKNTHNKGNLHHLYVGGRRVSKTYQGAISRAGKKM